MSSCCLPCGGNSRQESYKMSDEGAKEELSDNSDWMTNLPVPLHSKPINVLSIPGSHDSFSYYLDKSGPIAQDTPSAIKDLGKVFGSLVKDFIYKWSQCQSMDATNQLKAGIRYFDIRIAERTDNKELCICHGLYGHDMDTIMAQMLYFLEEHPKEIVFLDFNHFYGLSDARHQELVETVLQYVGHKVCPRQSANNLTLDEMWKNNWQVLIFYHYPTVQTAHQELWPGTAMQSPWPNEVGVSQLITDLEKEYENVRPGVKDGFFVFQGVLTPDTTYVIKHITDTIKQCLCDKIAQPYVDWLAKKSAGPKGIGVTIMDYVEEAKYINSVIGLNQKYADSLKG